MDTQLTGLISNSFEIMHPLFALSLRPTFDHHLSAVVEDLQTMVQARGVHTAGHLESIEREGLC